MSVSNELSSFIPAASTQLESFEMMQQVLVALAAIAVMVLAKEVSNAAGNVYGETDLVHIASNNTRRRLSNGMEKKDVCTIVVRDKIRGNLNWMQV